MIMIKCITPADKKYKSSEQVLFDDFCRKKKERKDEGTAFEE
jgi:hypothetical protein